METKSKPWGRTSLILGLSNILLVLLGLSELLTLRSEHLLKLAVFVTPLLACIGTVCGIIGLFTTRAWVGLVLNLMLMPALMAFIWMFAYCCAPLPSLP
jgi:hypothetical protein